MKTIGWLTATIVVIAVVCTLALEASKARADAAWEHVTGAWKARPEYSPLEDEQARESWSFGWEEARWFQLYEPDDHPIYGATNLRLRRTGGLITIELFMYPPVDPLRLEELHSTFDALAVEWVQLPR